MVTYQYDYQARLKREDLAANPSIFLNEALMKEINDSLAAYINEQLDKEQLIEMLRPFQVKDKVYEKNWEDLSELTASEIIDKACPRLEYDADGAPKDNRIQIIIDTVCKLGESLKRKAEKDRTQNEMLFILAYDMFSSYNIMLMQIQNINRIYDETVKRGIREGESPDEAAASAEDTLFPLITTYVESAKQLASATKSLMKHNKAFDRISHEEAKRFTLPQLDTSLTGSKNGKARTNVVVNNQSPAINRLLAALNAIAEVMIAAASALSRLNPIPLPNSRSLMHRNRNI